ncbi:MAG: hypothetical protein A2271_03750 [Candidatus Moranbacteria bacterium RIFOXYA12_FULL_35_19]|nr:MAG: Regulatory protein, MerR [Candidatus Moranbacteria bacterium GW2011_GWF2_35_39]OGI31837.1 MAG: hypothetical protein A2343_01315 [Candidatus Moranbacteria bacterium RIFOXYB12_FULL_35_8]OGI33360.1 MAG: hypothetical protein A2489_03865 [Candidatus Moranbacteria bacterium RIFOXYC12_FULL_36_13]OGI36290.1 MAG: hypothetical protein A2271_03750 [Candidatus Moranbacteria bacterium RIFOXYA12_FULL_35_19]
MSLKLISIGETAKKIGVSIDTLRRWDKKGRFLAIRKSGKRFYRESDVESFINQSIISASNLFRDAKEWVSNPDSKEPEALFYCTNSLIFQTRLMRFENNLRQIDGLSELYPLLSAIVGEIGNNSFDHNLGNWRDVPGVFFGYDIKKREVVLADRGQGIFKTLKRVKPDLVSDEQALEVAFSEIISGRAPEARGNGLKFVRKVIVANDMRISFQTGSAKLELKKGDVDLPIEKQAEVLNGCLVLINFLS